MTIKQEANDPTLVNLGQPIQTFKPAMGNCVAGFFLSAGLISGGLCALIFPLHNAWQSGWHLPWKVDKGNCWMAVIVFCVIGVLTIGAGGWLTWFSRCLIASSVVIYEHGLSRQTRKKVVTILWTEIVEITEVIDYERLPILKGPASLLLPKIKSISYRLTAIGGRQMAFDGNSIEKIRALGDLLRSEAEKQKIVWKKEEHNPSI